MQKHEIQCYINKQHIIIYLGSKYIKNQKQLGDTFIQTLKV